MSAKADREIPVHNDRYALSKILESDREEYVELQRQINGDTTFFLNPLSKDIMWDSALSDKGIARNAVDLLMELTSPYYGEGLLGKPRILKGLLLEWKMMTIMI